jgi:hypothetical protein
MEIRANSHTLSNESHPGLIRATLKTRIWKDLPQSKHIQRRNSLREIVSANRYGSMAAHERFY